MRQASRLTSTNSTSTSWATAARLASETADHSPITFQKGSSTETWLSLPFFPAIATSKDASTHTFAQTTSHLRPSLLHTPLRETSTSTSQSIHSASTTKVNLCI